MQLAKQNYSANESMCAHKWNFPNKLTKTFKWLHISAENRKFSPRTWSIGMIHSEIIKHLAFQWSPNLSSSGDTRAEKEFHGPTGAVFTHFLLITMHVAFRRCVIVLRRRSHNRVVIGFYHNVQSHERPNALTTK